MHEIKKHHLIEAMKAGRHLDGPAFLAAKCVRWPFGKAPWLKPFQPPFQQASFEHGVTSTATPPIAAKQTESSGLPTDQNGEEGANPIPTSAISITEFEQAAESATEIARQERDGSDWPFVRRSTLREALAEAAMAIANPVGEAKDLSRMRSGLQLFRVKIRGDQENDLAPLTLANGDLPFSLRFIACVFEIPLALSNLNLVTLDLSGSALTGVDATFLRARGSVRMRRCYSDAPVDFAGAQIHGYFDGCDMLLQPFGKLPAGQAVNGDRGMLNLNQASIDNEVRLIRAMIWGGLSMRGLKTLRSVWLDEAILLSPLAVLEKMFVKALDPFAKIPTKETRCDLKLPTPKRTAKYISGLEKLRSALDKITFDKCIAKDKCNDYIMDNCLDVLMRENLRVRTSGLRGDGVMIAGSLFARDIMCRGRLRLKYAKIDGALWLQGSKLSSAEALRATFDDVLTCMYTDYKTKAEKSGFENAIKISDYRLQTYEKLAEKTSVSGEESADDNLAFGAD